MDVVDRLKNLTVKDEDVEAEFHKDFGFRLRLVKEARIILEIGKQLRCSLLTIAKAQVLYHQYKSWHKRSSFANELVAAICLNLSVRLMEEDVSVNEVILKFYHAAEERKHVPNPSRPDPSIERLNAMKNNFLKAEFLVCKMMGLKLETETAHSYVYAYLGQLLSISDAPEPIMVAMSSAIAKLLSTYYMCGGCIDYGADEIASACIQFAYLFIGRLSACVRDHMKREIASFNNKVKICDIMDELVVVSDVATTLSPI